MPLASPRSFSNRERRERSRSATIVVMRIAAGLVLVLGCESGAPAPPTASPAPPPRDAVASDAAETIDSTPSVPLPAVTGGPLCGFTTFDEFDRETWRASSRYTYQVDRKPGDMRMWPTPDGKPPPLGAPPPVGTCRVHALDPQDGAYQIRSGKQLVADIAALQGPILRVPGFRIAGIGVGSTGAEMSMGPMSAPQKSELACSFSPIGNADEAATRMFLRGKLPDDADGDTATATARGSVVTGLQPFVMRSGPP